MTLDEAISSHVFRQHKKKSCFSFVDQIQSIDSIRKSQMRTTRRQSSMFVGLTTELNFFFLSTSVFLILLYRHFYQKTLIFYTIQCLQVKRYKFQPLELASNEILLEWRIFAANSTRCNFEVKMHFRSMENIWLCLWKMFSAYFYLRWYFQQNRNFLDFIRHVYMWRWPRNQYHWFHYVETKTRCYSAIFDFYYDTHIEYIFCLHIPLGGFILFFSDLLTI